MAHKENVLLCSIINDSPDFISGFECGQIWEVMGLGNELKSRPVRPISIEQIRLTCEAFGRTLIVEHEQEDWVIISTIFKAGELGTAINNH